ncbi:MAG: glycosyltransferase family 1 protein [Fibrobacter sp.]|jgi:alpha-1,6-mannosyltransferase|nr:glycosyltransferase family 1 protein [Fibrobacter sp.]
MLILDFNNFWSPSGGGVRRYHLERLKFYKNRNLEKLVFIMNDSQTYTEVISETVIIEHVKAFEFPFHKGYRFIWKKSQVVPYLKKYNPDIIEVGSPYFLPKFIARLAKKHSPNAKLFAFWHADFPLAYIERPLRPFLGRHLASLLKELAFSYAKYQYKAYHNIQASSFEVLKRLQQYFQNSARIPLGCDIQSFNPSKRDEDLVKKLKSGVEERKIIFFPHRFSKEKGLDLLLNAYSILSKRSVILPAIVFSGAGPRQFLIQNAIKKHKHLHFLGFIHSKEEMARYYASADIGIALSRFETFGLSILESMASGNILIAANAGAAKEHATHSKTGFILKDYSAEALADLIEHICNLDLKEEKKEARRYAESFTWEHCFTTQLHLYSNRGKYD